jgi:hypothetical protein
MRDTAWVRCPECEQVVRVPGEDSIRTPLFVATCSHCGLEFDWRLSSGKDFLRGALLAWQHYVAPSEIWDHDHCVMCHQMFLEADLPGAEHAGYVAYTPDEVWWICQRCFEELHEEMGWQAEPTEGPPV